MGANNKIQKQGKSLDFPNPCGNIAGRKNDCTELGWGFRRE